MASGNRVEELESKVNELEASVDGLTDELVECKVRIRELENVIDATVGMDAIDEAAPPTPEPSGDDGETTETAGSAEATKTEGADGDDNAESEDGEIIIA